MNARSLAKLNHHATVRSYEKRVSLHEKRAREFRLEQAQPIIETMVAQQHPDGSTPKQRQIIKRTILESETFNEYGFPVHDVQDTEQLRLRSNAGVQKTVAEHSAALQVLRLGRLLGHGFDRFLAAARRILVAFELRGLDDAPTTPPPLEQRPTAAPNSPNL